MKSPREIWTSPVNFLSFGFGSGLARVAPGTFGTLAAIPVYLLLQPLALPSYLLAAALCFLAGVWFCEKTARDLGVHDHPAIVWDEVVGFLITMAGVPLSVTSVVLGFLLFRLFDIAKPWPIRWFDRKVPGGLGIMLDDLLAALPAWALLQFAVRFI